MMRVIFFLIVLTIFLVWNYLIIKKRSPNHGAQAVYRSITWLVASFFFSGSDHELLVAYFIGFHLAFMFPFNTALNLMRGYSWNYIGNTAWIDKQGRKWPAVYIQGSFLLMIMGIGLLIWPTGY